MVTRWTVKITAFLHDPPGKALALRSTRHISHEEPARALQRAALGRPPDAGEEDRAMRADRIASASDRMNFPPGVTAYWDKVELLLLHPLSRDATPQPISLPVGMDLPQADDQVQEAAGHSRNGLVALWKNALVGRPDGDKRLYFHLWRLLYEDLSRTLKLGSLIQHLPAETRQPDHSLQHHLSISAAIADALPEPALLLFSIGPVREFIAAARRAQDLWMGSWLLSYLSWKAMETLADEFGPDVIVYPSLRGQPLCDLWLSSSYDVPCGPTEMDLARPILPNRFVALLPACEAERAARRAEEAVRTEWERLSEKVYQSLRTDVMPADRETDRVWNEQTRSHFELYWVVVPWHGADQVSGKAQAEAVMEAYEKLCSPPLEWDFREIYQAMKASGQYDPNWGTVYSLTYDLADRTLSSRKAFRNFRQTEEAGETCSQCGQRSALRSQTHDARSFWQAVAQGLRSQNSYDIRPQGKERLCAVCTVKRFVPRRVLQEELGLAAAFPSTSEVAAATFKARILRALRNQSAEVRGALADFLQVAYPHLAGVTRGTLLCLEKYKDALTHDVRILAEKLLSVDGEWLMLESWSGERLAEAGHPVRDPRDGRNALARLYRALGCEPARYYAVLRMDADEMGRWIRGSHQDMATFGDVLHPSVRGRLQNDVEPAGFLSKKRPITPAIHMAVSTALCRFALRLAPHIVEERYPGRLVYAGGDDLLALVPLEHALSVARELRAAFSGHVRLENGSLTVCFGDNVSGYIRWDDDLFLTMGPKATASIGMVFAHHSSPLDLVLHEADKALENAKTDYGRNALAVRVLRRSGETTTAGARWFYVHDMPDVVQLLSDLVHRLAQEKISSKWPYLIKAEAPALQALGPDAQAAELRRTLLRQAGRNVTPEEKEEQARILSEKLSALSQCLDQYLPPRITSGGFEEMARWLQICSFIARGGEL